MFDWLTRPKVANPLQTATTAKEWAKEIAKLEPLVASIEISTMLQRLTHDADIAQPEWINGLVAADDILANVESSLRKDYLSCLTTQNRQHEKLWDAGYRLNSRFYEVYYALAQHAQKWVDARVPRSTLAQMMARAIRYRELSYRYRLFRHEEWPPGTWLSVHQHFADTCELQLEDVQIGTEKFTGAKDVLLSAEREYIRLLLVKLCFSGNLTPHQLEELTDHLHEASGELTLTVNPVHEHGFFVDLTQPYGLRFLSRTVSGGQFLYIDTSPLCDRFKALLSSAEARHNITTDAAAKRTLSSQIAIFSSAAARVDPNFKPALRTSQRVTDRSPVWATIGIQSSFSALLSTREVLLKLMTEGSAYGGGDDMSTFGFVRQSTIATYRPQATASMGNGATIHRWELRDRSDTGFRCVASSEQASGLQLGSMVSVNDDDLSEWNICTVVRIVRGSSGYTELGLRTISRTPVAVEVQSLRTTLSTTARYDNNRPALAVSGIVLRNAFLETPIFPPTLLIARRDYDAGGQYRIIQGEKSDCVQLTDLLQEENEWVWANFRVIPDVTQRVMSGNSSLVN
jgi:hypothetical protein